MATAKVKQGLNWYTCWPRVVWTQTRNGWTSRSVTKRDEKRREQVATYMTSCSAASSTALSK